MKNPITTLSDLFSKFIIEHGSAVIQEKQIALLKEQFTILERENTKLKMENQILKTENKTLKKKNINLKSKIQILENKIQNDEWNQYERKVTKDRFVYFAHKSEQHIYACAVCKGKKPNPVILQPFWNSMHHCIICKTEGQIEY